MDLQYLTAPRTNGANPFKIFSFIESLDPTKEASLEFILKRMPYQFFLGTAYWFSVAQVVKARAFQKCQVCNSGGEIHVHHRTYDHHGMEHKHMIDLTALCDLCHGLFHGLVKAAPNSKKPVRVKIKHGTMVPHQDSDIVVPNEDSIVLTKDLINACRANGSFTNATIRAFGLNRQDMLKGWTFRLIGKSVSREDYRLAQEGRFIYNSGRL